MTEMLNKVVSAKKKEMIRGETTEKLKNKK